MSIHVALHHVTTYQYDRPVALGPQVIRLRPAPHCRTRILSYSLRVTPAEHFLNWQQDPQANYLARLVFPEKTRTFKVEVDLVAEMAVHNPFDFFLEADAEAVPFSYDPSLSHELEPYRRTSPLTPNLATLVAEVRNSFFNSSGSLRTIDFLVGLNQRLNSAIRYVVRMEPGVQSPEETLSLASGSCRDSAWLLCELLRQTGLASRFVSGYLIQLRPDVTPLDGPEGPTSDFTDLHAWCEVYLPGAGWIGLDPTSGLLAGEGHLPLAATPDPQSAAPISGAVEPANVSFDFQMSVQRIHESPRVTLPYSDDQWNAINALGRKVDATLVSRDVRLTMGGEPTFISIDDPDGEEWNTAALGPRKLILASQLIRRLRTRFGPGGLLHHGIGKWYPGEPLPRWSLGCWWRTDGSPLWRDDSLLADASANLGHGLAEARLLTKSIAEHAGVPTDCIMTAYEDVWHYLWRERRLPSNVDPLQSRLEDPLERDRLRRLFAQGLSKAVGCTLPIARHGSSWRSGHWFLRDETLYLTPGDSPMGLRLPLDSLPWVRPESYPYIHNPDPMMPIAQWPHLPSSHAPPRRPPPPPFASLLSDSAPLPQQSAPDIVRTALCVEPREGRLHVFMPPLPNASDYFELISIVEAAAAACSLPVIIEGEPPPQDPRLRVIKVTPDPGVIEVNLHPTSSWDELVAATEGVYEDARQLRLGTEKFMLDGRHTGTGGGNHIVMGAATPPDSPLLRRPHLLRSLLGFWLRHPSLSYLFSGLFIGPTSQHPRVDEARDDILHELEIAFRQIPDHADVPPWLVDRIFRHLLTDLTGNTHRAEFSIDKLFSPDSSSGRLGLLELRSFEMPPHPRMSLVQQLLVRTAVAHFWDHPLTPIEPVRWGTALHDRWMLPHFIREDLADVLSFFHHAGFSFDPAWFAPHFEFRFPLIGSFTHSGITTELRTALEPWHVLGEENNGSGTARYVDSSLERLQVIVRGLTSSRHSLLCNGRTVPLHPTGVPGEAVAGIRYRAWQPPSCLQPTIAPHVPLVFDLYDSWNNRSLGGAAYHVAHPGGRSFDSFPVNAFEAESRRLSRFVPHDHSPGTFSPTSPAPQRTLPFTLDLRLSL